MNGLTHGSTGDDLADLLDDPDGAAKARAHIERTARPADEAFADTDAPPPADDAPPDDTGQGKSAATALVELAEAEFEFGVSPSGEAFAVPRHGPRIVSTLKGSKSALRSRLARLYYQQHRRVASGQALTDALAVIEGMAQEGEERELHLRVAEDSRGHWLDLGDDTGSAVLITASGWSIETPPMLFKRTVLGGPLPTPEQGGDLDALWSTLNVAEADRPLLLTWLVSCLFPDIPHPVLALLGEQGTGKTTAHKKLVMLLDKGPVPNRKPPRDADTWVSAAQGSWIVGLDNLSAIPDWLSDSICRAVTGDGDVRRKLFTDGEHAVFQFRRCIALNGIDLGAIRGDLAERMLAIELQPIPESRRRDEGEVWDTWERDHGRLLGAVLDVAASVIRDLPSVALESRPRMADFANIVAAVDRVIGTDGLSAYLGKVRAMARDSLAGDAFIACMVEALPDGFVGTSAELLTRFRADRPPKGWPTTARKVTAKLRRNAPALRKNGWTIEDDGGANHANSITWTLHPPRPDKGCNRHSQHSRASQAGREATQGKASSDTARASVTEHDTRTADDTRSDTRGRTLLNATDGAGSGVTASVASIASVEYTGSHAGGVPLADDEEAI